MKNLLNNLLKDDSGQDLIEYALVATVLGLGAITALDSAATAISSALSAIGTSLTAALPKA